MSYVRTLTICLLLFYFVSAAGRHCFDLDTDDLDNISATGISSDVSEYVTDTAGSHIDESKFLFLD